MTKSEAEKRLGFSKIAKYFAILRSKPNRVKYEFFVGFGFSKNGNGKVLA